MLLDEFESGLLLDGGDLDELGDAVAHVLLRQRLEEVEVEDDSGVRVEGADAVLVLPRQVAAHLDPDRVTRFVCSRGNLLNMQIYLITDLKLL